MQDRPTTSPVSQDAASAPSPKAAAEALIPQFQFERMLNQDQAGRRVSLYGTIKSQSAILLVERAAFPTDTEFLKDLPQTLTSINNLGANDIYSWFLSSSSSSSSSSTRPTLKLNLIYPCTPQHIAKYSSQGVRSVTETPNIYRDHVRPYMRAKRDAGRLAWVYNIIEGRTEQEDVIYRAHSSQASAAASSNNNEGFLLLPDLNWDRKTLTSLHLLGLVERRDIWSVRDLSKAHVPWLKHMRQKLLAATIQLYPELEADQVKLYVHYHPTYYHFHVHVVHVKLEAGATQAVGKALGLDDVISQLEVMAGDGGSMADLSLTYTVGEASELWLEIFRPLKERAAAAAAAAAAASAG